MILKAEGNKHADFYIYIYFACLSVSLFVSNETAKPIEPKFCARPHMTTGKVYG